MSIPPFPSQDLAKLVLGYLAEEQLMTAYDEFLQASPYLDALGNEYDRIFMTSLKNILAEYRAVKIYVETCKPFILRRKLFQCTNLLETVKFLIQYVDLNKLQSQDSNQYKYSGEKQNTISTQANSCDVCNSLKLDRCACISKNYSVCSTQLSSSLQNSVETTSLSDLPGNHVTCRKKNPKAQNDDQSEISVTIEQSDVRSKLTSNNEVVERSSSSNVMSQNKTQNVTENTSNVTKPSSLENSQKEEFYSILNQVCKKNETNNTSPAADKKSASVAGAAGYRDFATGVSGGEGVNIVPDSSTSENLHVHVPSTKEVSPMINIDQNVKMQKTITQYLLKSKNNTGLQPNEIVSINTVTTVPKVKAKTDENKIRILSDIKVDNNESLGATGNVPLKLKNATSTPLLQMQTILINGTPVYKHQPLGHIQNYTKDEIMAMPTIILAPAPDRTLMPSQPSTSNTNQPIPRTSTSARPLGPLIIDVTSDNTAYLNQINSTNPVVAPPPVLNEVKETNVPKVADVTSASAPKDNTVIGNIETSTPQGLPPLRKSLSTPRRTSHVRVLDFTTPRRILHETINECVPNIPESNDVEVIVSKSPNFVIPAPADKVISANTEDNTAGLKENNIQSMNKKSNWDADLRRHALSAAELNNLGASPKPKPKPKTIKKRKSSKNVSSNATNDTVKDVNVKKKTAKTKLPKGKSSIEEITEVITIPDDKVEVPIKPTINIIPGNIAEMAKDRVPSSTEKHNKSHNKSNSDDHIDTPDMERMSLQNEIGAKLNISDLLETPYKQALYDIQMETPRFLGPDVPDDPMSDIKIMNIPTPRFLTNATPSSYSSRPTDYSSGGSYYKPDDQDYMRIQDDDCHVTSTKPSTTTISINDDRDSKEKENLKPSRPVRECTRNVSYKRSKPKPVSNKPDSDGSSVDSVTIAELVAEKEIPKKVDSKSKTTKTKPLAVKKFKSPVKKDKSFMRIKPRRPTPTKKETRGRKKMSDPSNHSKVQTRKKAANKERNEDVKPVVTCAPTKSRRKSSTPRKLHCSKSFNSESSGHESPVLVSQSKEKVPGSSVTVQDSDNEQLPLRWSDDGSQEPKPLIVNIPVESEDITKIQEYIETTVLKKPKETEGSLHIDLVKRGFDLETAKIIERDLLDSTPQPQQQREIDYNLSSKAVETIVVVDKHENPDPEKTVESNHSNNLHGAQNEDEEEDDEIELSVHECDEESVNYISCSHDATKDTPSAEPVKFKDKFCMEVCIDDGVSIRLRATPFSVTLDQDPQTVEYLDYSYRETEIAVSSISNMDKLYTPMKEAIKAQVFEIFDSTLTSLDTPLKATSPMHGETEVSVTQIVLEVEKEEVKEKGESKKRKRAHSGNVSDEGSVEIKKSKPETQYNLFSSANIQNIDIESVLSKLHGP